MEAAVDALDAKDRALDTLATLELEDFEAEALEREARATFIALLFRIALDCVMLAIIAVGRVLSQSIILMISFSFLDLAQPIWPPPKFGFLARQSSTKVSLTSGIVKPALSIDGFSSSCMIGLMQCLHRPCPSFHFPAAKPASKQA